MGSGTNDTRCGFIINSMNHRIICSMPNNSTAIINCREISIHQPNIHNLSAFGHTKKPCIVVTGTSLKLHVFNLMEHPIKLTLKVIGLRPY